jgi:hypothetical protein
MGVESALRAVLGVRDFPLNEVTRDALSKLMAKVKWRLIRHFSHVPNAYERNAPYERHPNALIELVLDIFERARWELTKTLPPRTRPLPLRPIRELKAQRFDSVALQACVPIMEFLLWWLGRLTDSPVEGVERRNGHGSKLVSLVCLAASAVSTFVFQYGRHDYGVLSLFFGEHWTQLTDIDGPSIIQGRISIAKEPHYTQYDIGEIRDVWYEIIGDHDDPSDVGVGIAYPCDREKEMSELRRIFEQMRRARFGNTCYAREACLPRRLSIK